MRKENVIEKEKTRPLVSEGEVAWLIVENGPDKGKEFSIDKPIVTIGRARSRLRRMILAKSGKKNFLASLATQVI